MNATLQILEAAGAALEIETIEIGEKVYLRGNTAGIEPSSWESLLRTKVFLKAPITTPAGRRFQEPQRDHPQDAGPVRQRPPVRVLPSVRRHQASRHGCGDRSRERRRPVRGHRIPAHAGSHLLHQADLPAGQREDRPLRLRIRPPAQSQEGHLLHEGQHHEDDRRALPQGLRRDRGRAIRTSRRKPGSWTSAPPRWPTRRKPSTSS